MNELFLIIEVRLKSREFKSNSNHFSNSLKMFCLLILLLISVSIDCENHRQHLCSLIKPNGTYKGLGIYKRFFENYSEEFVMFNRAGAEWLFDVTSANMTGLFNIKLRADSVKNVQDRGVAYRFSSYHLSQTPMDCRVETAVKLLNYNKLVLFSIN